MQQLSGAKATLLERCDCALAQSIRHRRGTARRQTAASHEWASQAPRGVSRKHTHPDSHLHQHSASTHKPIQHTSNTRKHSLKTQGVLSRTHAPPPPPSLSASNNSSSNTIKSMQQRLLVPMGLGGQPSLLPRSRLSPQQHERCCIHAARPGSSRRQQAVLNLSQQPAPSRSQGPSRRGDLQASGNRGRRSQSAPPTTHSYNA